MCVYIYIYIYIHTYIHTYVYRPFRRPPLDPILHVRAADVRQLPTMLLL